MATAFFAHTDAMQTKDALWSQESRNAARRVQKGTAAVAAW